MISREYVARPRTELSDILHFAAYFSAASGVWNSKLRAINSSNTHPGISTVPNFRFRRLGSICVAERQQAVSSSLNCHVFGVFSDLEGDFDPVRSDPVSRISMMLVGPRCFAAAGRLC